MCSVIFVQCVLKWIAVQSWFVEDDLNITTYHRTLRVLQWLSRSESKPSYKLFLYVNESFKCLFSFWFCLFMYFLLLFSTEQMLQKAVLNHNNLVKYGILTSNVLVPSYIHQLDTRDECQPALLPQPNNIIRPGSSFKHRASLCQNPKQWDTL